MFLLNPPSDAELIVASLLHEYGNLELATDDYAKAEEDYQDALDMIAGSCPWHLLTATLYYKLAVVKALSGQIDLAMYVTIILLALLVTKRRENIDKALEIVNATQLRGAEARILWRKALILEKKHSLSLEEQDDLNQLRIKASQLKDEIEQKFGRVEIDCAEATEDDNSFDRDNEYDRLVPGFYR